MGRSGCNSARCNRQNRRARNGPCQRIRIHTVATGVIDNGPAPSCLVNCGRLGRVAQVLPTAVAAAVSAPRDRAYLRVIKPERRGRGGVTLLPQQHVKQHLSPWFFDRYGRASVRGELPATFRDRFYLEQYARGL